MGAMIDTLQFAERFEGAGFAHEQARALASAFASANEIAREDLVTKPYFDTRLAEFETRLVKAMTDADGSLAKQMSDADGSLAKQLSDMEVRLTRQIGEVGVGLSNRLWSTVAIIAGVSTAISATIGAGVALILKQGM